MLKPFIDNALNKFLSNDYVKSMFLRAYDGATTSKSIHWITSNTSANLESLAGLEILRNRARDLVRNNAYAESAVASIAANTIGTGIIPEFKGKFDQSIWEKWADSCDCDADGLQTLYGLQVLVMREVVEAGECIVRKCYSKYNKLNRNIPLKLRLLGSEYIDISKNGFFNELNYVSQGIEFDPSGARVAYYLFPYHPENDLGLKCTSIRVPEKEIIHVYRPKRSGQMRGITWFAPVLMDLKNSDNYQTAELKRKEVNACFAGFIKDRDDFGHDVTQNKDEVTYGKINPGMLSMLPSGKDIVFSSPQVDSHYESYNSSILRKIASGLKIPYEILTGDLSQVNFSSGRLGFLEFQRNLELWRWHMMIPMFCEKVTQWFLESAEICGHHVDGINHIEYTAPRREMIDPVRETAAMRDAIRSGLKTYKETLRECGYNPKKVIEEIDESNKLFDSKKIILDSDPRKVTQQGILQQSQNKTNHKNRKKDAKTRT